MKDSLNKKGLKATPQRMEIIKYLNSTKSHPSAEEVYVYIKDKFPTVSFATVYNTLQTLKNTGDLKELSIDPDRKRFDRDLTPHNHFFCKICKKIYDIPNINEKVNIDALNDHLVEDYSIYYTGICKDCKKMNKEE
ncbi:MAG: transcriptional repressor [Proteobacteria bacterium]|nr:transcriptional repressor [Pseudomonadota bacterium]